MKNRRIFLSVCLLLIVSALISCGKKEESSEKPIAETTAPKEMKDSLVIVTYGVETMNALEVLKQEHEVNEVSSAMGTFVKGIDGVENDMYTFWFFEINGEMAEKAADQIETFPSDTIIWYFRQPGSEKPPAERDSM